MPPARKSPERRQRRNTPELGAVTVLPSGGSVRPVASPDWLPETVAEWEALWSSDLVSVIQSTDHPAISRLFDWRDRLTRTLRLEQALRDQAIESPFVDGSKGQPVANPLFASAEQAGSKALQIEARIVALEDRLGLSPRARLGLGVTQQQGINLAGQNSKMAAALQEAMRGIDPRSLPGDAAVDAS